MSARDKNCLMQRRHPDWTGKLKNSYGAKSAWCGEKDAFDWNGNSLFFHLSSLFAFLSAPLSLPSHPRLLFSHSSFSLSLLCSLDSSLLCIHLSSLILSSLILSSTLFCFSLAPLPSFLSRPSSHLLISTLLFLLLSLSLLFSSLSLCQYLVSLDGV